MRWKKRSLKSCKLYLILDREVHSYGRLFDIFKKAVRGGVDIVQLRDKRGSAAEIFKFSAKAQRFARGRVIYIVNDRVDLAVAANASGVHLGQDDLNVTAARKMIGPDAFIGVSCQSLRHARKAVRDGADYVGFGSVFKTKTKPDRAPMDLKLLSDVLKKIRIPVFPIGGIRQDNLVLLREHGVQRAAVCRAICQARDVAEATREFKRILNG